MTREGSPVSLRLQLGDVAGVIKGARQATLPRPNCSIPFTTRLTLSFAQMSGTRANLCPVTRRFRIERDTGPLEVCLAEREELLQRQS